MVSHSPHILSVCTSYKSGGAAKAAFRIHQGVNAIGGDSTMFVKGEGDAAQKVIGLQDMIPKNPFYKAFEWTLNKCKNQWQHYQWGKYPQREEIFMSDLRSADLNGAFRRLDFDILHLHWINQRFFPLQQLPKDKPIVWTLHDSWPFCGVCHYFWSCEAYQHQCGSCPFLHSNSANDLSHSIWKQKMKYYKGLNLHIVAPSRWLGACAQKSSLLGHFPVTVIPNGLDTTVFCHKDEISPRWRDLQETGKPLVLFGAVNATSDRIKGFANLTAALRILEQQGYGEKFELVVFGADRPLNSMPSGIPTHYVGYVSDTNELVSLYNMASVMVVPSMTENLSCAIMESLSCGTPVVAFNIGGNGDMIEHKSNGYLAVESDDEDLANGILWCLENNDNRALSENARTKVLENYTIEKIAEQYSKLYQNLL